MTEAELAYRTNHTDLAERDQAIIEGLPQVRYIAARIRERLPKHVPLEDLVNAGIIGLINAYRSYDASKCVQFRAYSKFRIRGAILDSLREMDWGSRPLRRKSREIEQACNELEKRLGRQPTDLEIADELDIDLEEFYKITARLDGLALVSQQIACNADRSESYDIIESAPSPDENPFEQLLRSESNRQLADAVARLSERERLVVSLYYAEEMTMKEIALILDSSESRVSQLHSAALVKLRVAMSRSRK